MSKEQAREQAIDEMLEIIGRCIEVIYKARCLEKQEKDEYYMNQFEKMGEEMRALKGEQE